MDYSRYKLLVSDGKFYKVPFIEVPTSPTDAYAIYEVGKSRLDLIPILQRPKLRLAYSPSQP